MKTTSNSAANDIGKNEDRSEAKNEEVTPQRSAVSRRYFLGKSLAVGATTLGAGLLAKASLALPHGGGRNRRGPRPRPTPPPRPGGLTAGDAALLRFAAAAEILEADFWIQYNELGGVQDAEVPGGSGNPEYTEKLEALEEDFPQYIHDNTDDEITHFTFLNAYLRARGASPANLNQFRILEGS